MHSHALIYSSKEEITIGNLKKGQYDPMLDVSDTLQRLSNHKVGAFVEGTPTFHYKFQKIQSKPYIMYYLGNKDLLNQPMLAIVGPRNHSDYAKLVVEKCINQASSYGLVTISGLAPGVDQLAHKYSLQNNIPTIAVLGGGLKYFLSSKDRALINNIVDHGGLVLSEFKLEQIPQTYTYPQRNRIIAGLADVVFLPEASKNSGSLITVEFAQKLHKPIYGTPNTISPSTSEGLHEQLQKGSIIPLFDFPAMLSKHFYKQTHTSGGGLESSLSRFDPDTQKLLISFQKQPSLTIETLLQQGFSKDTIYLGLARLEMDKCIQQPTPGTYVLA